MKCVNVLVLLISICLFFGCGNSEKQVSLSSPDQNIEVVIKMDNEGEPAFSITHKKSLILDNSSLGILMEDKSFMDHLAIKNVTGVTNISQDYTMHQGKRKQIGYRANERTIELENTQGNQISLVFRVSNDGVGFRYVFKGTDSPEVIKNELTAYKFPAETTMWVQPMSVAKSGWESSNPSYEEAYMQEVPVNTLSPLGAGYVYPALFRVDSTWVLISETDLDANYCGSRLEWDTIKNQMRLDFPDHREVFTGKGHLPTSDKPWESPWRILTIGSLEDIVESTLGTDLAEPAIQMDESVIQPGYASWSWVILKDNSVNFETSKDFIDYAQRMNWSYCLIDADWDTRIGEKKMLELINYANDRNVGLLLWYNSAGDWNTTPYHPKSQLLTKTQRETEFSKLKDWGIKGVKIDFFGGDGQSMIAYYHDILKDAAAYGLLVNFHGATLPRGWHRTYPNLLTVEAIKGYEFITFTQDVANQEATHAAMLPFTRNVFDPMDFTPMCFSDIPNIERKTTNGFELALPTLFHSGIQHMAEIPSGMAAVPDYVQEYLSNLPSQWDETKLIEGYPGKSAVMARKAGGTWYITGINGEDEAKELTMDLSFLKGYKGAMISDGDNHPEFSIQEVSIDSDFNIQLKPNGGFVMKLKP